MDLIKKHTVDRPVIRPPFRKIARLVLPDSVLCRLAIRHRLKLERGRGDVVGVVLVQPRALGDIPLLGMLGVLVEESRHLGLVEPVLAALGADVARPRAALGLVVHLDRDPGDADGVLLRRDTDVLGAGPRGELVDGEVVRVAGFANLGAARLADVVVVGVPGVGCANIAFLWNAIVY